MELKGFVGPAYVSVSRNVAVQTLENWYPQTVEVPSEPTGISYLPRPGTSLYAAIANSPIRALFEQDGRIFAVAGQNFYELHTNAVPTSYGMLSAIDARPATINSNGKAGHQLYITSGGLADIFDLTANTLTPITAAGYPADAPMGTYLDTYFLTVKGDSAQFNISDSEDGAVWNSLDFAIRVAGSDNLVGIQQFNKLIWLIGSKTSEPWYESGAASFPFQAVPQVLIEMGCCAPDTITRGSSALFWLHGSERGKGIFVAASDYSPKRVSTYALEAIWASYPTIADAVAYALTWEGHEFILLHFPSGNATFAYDQTEGLWSKWSWWNATTGAQDRFRGWVHCDTSIGHLVGDWETGSVYLLDGSLSTDDGQPIIWERTAPHLKNDHRMYFYANPQLDMEVGLGGSTPTARLSWSNDGGHTFTEAIDMDTGAIGEYDGRCRVPGNVGQSRDRAFRVRVSNDEPPRVNNFYIDVIAGTN